MEPDNCTPNAAVAGHEAQDERGSANTSEDSVYTRVRHGYVHIATQADLPGGSPAAAYPATAVVNEVAG